MADLGQTDPTTSQTTLGDGPRDAPALFARFYEELRKYAGVLFRAEKPDHTLSPTAIIHEAYQRMVVQTGVHFVSKAQFFAGAARAMRRALVDHARAQDGTLKRGKDWKRVDLAQVEASTAPSPADLVVVDWLLEELVELDEQGARVVELKFFGGLTEAEIAEVLEVSKRKVQADWASARAWIGQRLREHMEQD